jgi:hypothetical protein
MPTTITIELDDKTKRLVRIYQAAHNLGNMEEAINQIIKESESKILRDAGK